MEGSYTQASYMPSSPIAPEDECDFQEVSVREVEALTLNAKQITTTILPISVDRQDKAKATARRPHSPHANISCADSFASPRPPRPPRPPRLATPKPTSPGSTIPSTIQTSHRYNHAHTLDAVYLSRGAWLNMTAVYGRDTSWFQRMVQAASLVSMMEPPQKRRKTMPDPLLAVRLMMRELTTDTSGAYLADAVEENRAEEDVMMDDPQTLISRPKLAIPNKLELKARELGEDGLQLVLHDPLALFAVHLRIAPGPPGPTELTPTSQRSRSRSSSVASNDTAIEFAEFNPSSFDFESDTRPSGLKWVPPHLRLAFREDREDEEDQLFSFEGHAVCFLRENEERVAEVLISVETGGFGVYQAGIQTTSAFLRHIASDDRTAVWKDCEYWRLGHTPYSQNSDKEFDVLQGNIDGPSILTAGSDRPIDRAKKELSMLMKEIGDLRRDARRWKRHPRRTCEKNSRCWQGNTKTHRELSSLLIRISRRSERGSPR
ncbi:uncharacterized protein J4E79_008590 [Alternaria viburni]|uniref:uncharacterized protein n=1 Tax=Alternaria viburni TaxID=566460 RepID=UPI0020C1BD32|nr:uncharacterized protein J4E79_008590 [Alternaria viburni]KAI4653077.1 hypothetical protein J4E79_008590 [Alternaria viburni]